MNRFDDFLAKRKFCGEYLKQHIGRIDGIKTQKVTEKTEPSYSYFSLTIDPEQDQCTRDQFMAALQAENIECAVHYPIPLTKQPIIMEMFKPEPCMVSEMISERIMSIPIHPALTNEELKNIVEAVEKVATHYHK
jgi:perosamine synthetase